MASQRTAVAPILTEEPDPVLEAVQRTARRLVALTASALLRDGSSAGVVSLPGYRILVLIDGGITAPSDLADELEVTRPAVAQILGRLVLKNLVVRHSHGEDGRRSVLSVTRKGRALIDAVTKERARRLRPALKQLSASERDELLRGLTRLEQALAR
ncbi:MAG TPA: MarR family transcriptional regulator [Actinomycetota bacterium]|nr:MarR family transcriptional regulator [Actinomycetota bacterium]